MSNFEVVFIPEAEKDLKNLDRSQQLQVIKALGKLASNPFPVSEGGYGKPLGNREAGNLAGLLKVKLRGAGLRIVYKLERKEKTTRIIVIGAREDSVVYKEAFKRRVKHHL